MKWHLHSCADRNHVLATLDVEADILKHGHDASVASVYRAAIALLEAAAPYGDDEIVVRHESGAVLRVYDWAEDIGGWYGGCKLYGFGAYGGDTQAVFAIDRCAPLTPAADSLLRALRGDE